MNRILLFSLLSISIVYNSTSQDWSSFPVPADAGTGNEWELQSAPSDEFNYVFNETASASNFGSDKWYNFYHNSWDGPGTTYWQRDHVSVNGSDLVLRASRNLSTDKMGVEGVNAGCITSNNKVLYPVFVEASVSVANIALASDVWLLSPDDTQEIDIIECYGGAGSNNSFFAKYIHLSHHSFVRQPFQDYQPRDWNSWWEKSGVTAWGDYCWNNGDRRYVRVGVNWIGPKHFEYFIDGELVRVLYDKAFATKKGSTWYYTYPTMTGGVLDFDGGYQYVVQHATGSVYSFETLEAASNASSVSVVDPYNYQGGNGFTKELDIIINVESQNWHVEAGRTPSTPDLNDPAKNKMLVDWIRVYKPVISNPDDVAGVVLTPSEKRLVIGETLQLNDSVYPSTAIDKSVSWSSSDNSVATVNSSGLVSAIAEGSANITVTTTDGGYTAISTVEVFNPNKVVTIEAEDLTDNGGSYDDGNGGGINVVAGVGIDHVNSGDWAEYTLTITNEGQYDISYYISTPSDNAEIKAYIDDEAIATDAVPNNGSWTDYYTLTNTNLIPLSAGTYTLKIEATGSNNWQWNLDKIEFYKVREIDYVPVSSISVSPTSYTLNAGQTVSLTETILPNDASDKSVTWSSDNPSVATVSSTGVVTTTIGGTVSITVTSNDGPYSATSVITVNVGVTGVSLPNDTESVTIGETVDLNESITPANATNKTVSWSSDNSDIASVNSNGTVTGVAVGTTTITVTTLDGGYTDNVTVTVNPVSVSGVSLSSGSESMMLGTSIDLTPTVTPPNATNKEVSWSSSNTDIASVNSSGKVTAENVGSASITVITVDGNHTATVNISVLDSIYIDSINIYPTSNTIEKGDTVTLFAIISPNDATNRSVSWRSSNSDVASVTQTGVVTGISPGVATVTVISEQGEHEASTLVTVVDEITDIAETEIESLQIYPNPAYNTVNLKGIPEGYYTLNVINLQGAKIVNMQTYVNEITTLDISHLLEGIYILNIKGEKTTKSVVFNKID